MRHLIREGSIYILLSAGLLACNHFFLPSRPARAGQWNEIEKSFLLLTVARQPGICTRFPFNGAGSKPMRQPQ